MVGRGAGGGARVDAEADAIGGEAVLKERLRAVGPQPARPLFALGEVEIGCDVSLRGDERVTPSDDVPPSGKAPGALRLHLVPHPVDGPKVVLLVQLIVLLVQLTDPGSHTIRDDVAVGICVQSEHREAARKFSVHPDIESRPLIVDLKKTAIATGSACTSAEAELSYVITAMHDGQRAHSSVRISVGRANEEEQIDEAAQRIADATEQLRVFTL